MKKGKAGIRGIDNVVRNLNRALDKKKRASVKGLILAAAFIRRDMESTPPLIPVDTGNLRASWFTTTGYRNGDPFIQMGFNAEYAVLVHEMTDADVQWKRSGSGPKFFESALKRNKETLLRIIATGMKV
jgi:hypothetical protein